MATARNRQLDVIASFQRNDGLFHHRSRQPGEDEALNLGSGRQGSVLYLSSWLRFGRWM